MIIYTQIPDYYNAKVSVSIYTKLYISGIILHISHFFINLPDFQDVFVSAVYKTKEKGL